MSPQRFPAFNTDEPQGSSPTPSPEKSGSGGGGAGVDLDRLAEAFTVGRRRLRTNAVAWHTKFHERRIDFEVCDIASCTNDQDALALIDSALAALAAAGGGDRHE